MNKIKRCTLLLQRLKENTGVTDSCRGLSGAVFQVCKETTKTKTGLASSWGEERLLWMAFIDFDRLNHFGTCRLYIYTYVGQNCMLRMELKCHLTQGNIRAGSCHFGSRARQR